MKEHAYAAATEKFPLVKFRAIPHQVNIYPLVDFIYIFYLHIITFFHCDDVNVTL